MEIDGAGFGKITRRAGDLSDPVAGKNYLRQHLVVKNEVIVVAVQRKCFQNLSGERSVTGVIFRKLIIQQNILKKCEESIRDVFVEGHTTLQRASAKDARAKRNIVFAIGQQPAQRNEQLCQIL